MISAPRSFITGPQILLADGLSPATIVIENGWITDIATGDQTLSTPMAQTTQLPPGAILSPGMIDVQVNGGGGVLLNDTPTRHAIEAIGQAHRNLGTTGFLPTLITDAVSRMHEAAAAFHDAASDLPGLLGLHFEGPFLNIERAGIHDRQHIRRMTEADRDFLLSLAKTHESHRILLTLAPENVEDSMLSALSESGILLSAGHCTASPARLESAFRHGLRGFTHLFNAMPPIESRRPGPVAAALMDDESWCGVIADAIHVDPLLLKLTLRCKKRGRVFLVSDAMSPAGTDRTEFRLNGQRIRRVDGRLTNDTGTLAGADLSLPQAVKILHENGVDLAEALRMASTYPADFLNMPHLGRIVVGSRADFTQLSATLTVEGTWLHGVWQAAR
jgi:N-acetylglucosamine-6-phosphate deacetylase